MLRLAPAILALTTSLATTLAHAAPTSIYTDIDTANGTMPGCETLDASKPGDGEWANVRCPGPAGVWAYIDYSDARDTVRIGKDGKGTKFEAVFTSLGPKAEWRMEGDVPVAMILRLKRGSDGKTSQALTVHKVDAKTGNGCLVAEVSAAQPDANVTARRVADELVPKADCATVDALRPDHVEKALEVGAFGQFGFAPGVVAAHGGIDHEISSEDCLTTFTGVGVGAMTYDVCYTPEGVSEQLLVSQRAGQVLVGIGRPQGLRTPIPGPHEPSRKLRLIPEGGKIIGAIQEIGLTSDYGEAFTIWQIIRASHGAYGSCVINYGPGTADEMSTFKSPGTGITAKMGVDYARMMLKRSLEPFEGCGTNWSRTYSTAPKQEAELRVFENLMGMMNVQFSP